MNENSLISLEEKVHKAFAGVQLEGGIGLFQAQAIDDWLDERNEEIAKESDERIDWRIIPTDALNQCSSSLSFLDAKGMRFLFPAFLLAEIKGDYTECSVLYEIYLACKEKDERFALFNQEQKRVIFEFIKWAYCNSKYENHQNELLDMLTMQYSFW